MRIRTVCAVCVALLVWHRSVDAQRHPPAHPDLQGTWNGATLTPLQRPAEFKDKAAFTPEEAAEYARTWSERTRSRLPTADDRLTQADLEEDFVESEAIKMLGLRTSLIVDPPSGVLPPLLPSAQDRLAARPRRSFDDPETLGLAERCLLGNFGLGGSLASPPLIPSVVIPAYYQIVQTDAYVLIFAEWVHDARVIRMNGTHVSPAIRKWLGDSIGHWEGSTLVVDTTNFRADSHNLDSGEGLHVVERFTKVDAKTLRYRVTVNDPETWTTAWTAEWPFTRIDVKLYGVDCHEGNYAIENFMRGARAEERRARGPLR